MFTIEFTHNGQRRQLETDATTEEMARISFANIRKQSTGDFVLHLETMKHHATVEEANAEVARFRQSVGKPAQWTEAEIARNSREVITNPAVFIPPDDEDDYDDE